MNFNLSSLLYHDREWFVFQEVLSRFPKDKATTLQQRLMSCQKVSRITSRLGISRDWVIGNRKTKLMERHFIEDEDQGRHLLFSGVLISSENFQKLLHDFFSVKVTIIIEQFTLTETLFASDIFQWYYDPSQPETIAKVKVVHGKRVPTELVHGIRPPTDTVQGDRAQFEIVHNTPTEDNFLDKRIRTSKKSKRRHCDSSNSLEPVSDTSKSIDSTMNTTGSESVVRSRRKKAKAALELISEIARDENWCDDENSVDNTISVKEEPISPKHYFITNNSEEQTGDTVRGDAVSSDVIPFNHNFHADYSELSMACSPEIAPFPYGMDQHTSTSHSLQVDNHSTEDVYSQVEQDLNMVKTEKNSGTTDFLLNEQNKGLVTPADSTSDNLEPEVSCTIAPNRSPSGYIPASTILDNIKERQKQLFTAIDDTDLDSLSAVDESEGNWSNGGNSEYGASKTTPSFSNKEQAITNSVNCDNGQNNGGSAAERIDNKAEELLNGLIATGFVPQVRQLLENVKNGGSQTKAHQLEQDIKSIKSRIRQKKKSNQQLQVNIKKKAKELESLFDSLKEGKDQCDEMEREYKKLESEKIQVEQQIKKCLEVLNSLN